MKANASVFDYAMMYALRHRQEAMTANTGLRKGERTAQRILDAAETLMATKGYRSTTVREIAESAGIQEPGLYNHFKSKEVLFSAMLDRALKPLAKEIETQLTESLDLSQLASRIIYLLADHPNVSILFQQALIAPDENPGHDLVLDWLTRLCERSLLLYDTPDDRDTQVLKLIAMFSLATGYFTAMPLINRLRDKRRGDAKLLEKHCSLVNELAGGLFRL